MSGQQQIPYLEERKLIKRWSGPWPMLANMAFTLLIFAVTLHNIPEGMAVGLAFALAADGESLAGAFALALGIGVQNFPEGAAVALPVYQAGMPLP